MLQRKELYSKVGRMTLAVALAALLASVPRSAKADFGIANFESGIPASWTLTTGGVAGTDVTATNIAPTEGSAYGYITTAGATTDMNSYGYGASCSSAIQNGTILTSQTFMLADGDTLHIDLNFLSNDNEYPFDSGLYHDLAVVELLDTSSGGVVATLYSVEATRVGEEGIPAPSCGYPLSPGVILTPPSTLFDGVTTGPVGGVLYGTDVGFSVGASGWVRTSYAPGAGSYQLRFVVANTGLPDPTDFDSALAIDNVWSEGPTAVELMNFGAEVSGNDVLITWETATELDNLGFNLYRGMSTEGSYVKVNDSLIPTQNPGQALGATYIWVDEGAVSGSTQYYLLEDIDINGVSTTHGPVSVVAQSPTALSLASVSAQNGMLLTMVLTVVSVVSIFTLRRRSI